MGEIDKHIDFIALNKEFNAISKRLKSLEDKESNLHDISNIVTALNILSIQVAEIKHVIKCVSELSIITQNGLNRNADFSKDLFEMISSLQYKLREIIHNIKR